MLRKAIGLVAAALLVVVVPGTTGAAAAAPTAPTTAAPTADQVPWRWWDGAAHQLTNGLADPPGLNRDDCRPTAERPNPVILVHGTGLNGGNSWATVGAALAAEGFCVWAPTVGAPPGPGGGAGSVGGIDSLTGASAPQLAAEIDRVRALTGAEQVDLVGHSQGAIIASYVAATARADAVRTVVTLGADPARSGDGPPEFVTAEIDRVRALTGAEQVDLVGHSQGAIIASFVAATARADAVRTVVTLGADPARSGDGPPEFVTAATETFSADTAQRDAEATLAWLGEEGVPFVRGVRYVAVSSDYDELTGPVVAPTVPDWVDLQVVRLQDGCEVDRSGHLTVLASPRAVDLVVDALAAPVSGTGDPGPARCVPADQLLGGLAPVPLR